MTPVKKENGAVSVAVGSHRSPVGPIVNLSTGIAENGAGHTFDPNAFDEVCLELNAGDALIFTPTLYHMSHPNLSESARSAWSSVWAHPDSQWDPSRVPRHPRSKEVSQGCNLGAFDWERKKT